MVYGVYFRDRGNTEYILGTEGVLDLNMLNELLTSMKDLKDTLPTFNHAS